MPKSFIIAPLASRQIDQAFPLVQPLLRDLTPERWRALAEHYRDIGADGGVMACASENGHLRGLFAWRVEAENGERVLVVPLFIALGLFDVAATAAALSEALGQLAWEGACAAIVVERAGSLVAATAPKLDAEGFFAGQGYEALGDRLVKAVEAEDETGFPVMGAA